MIHAIGTPAVPPPGRLRRADRVRRAVVGYLPAPGYGEMFAEAGFADVVEFARTGPHPRDLLAAVPDELVAAVALLGDPHEVTTRLSDYAAAGVDEIAVVPVSTDRDPGGAATLKAVGSASVPWPPALARCPSAREGRSGRRGCRGCRDQSGASLGRRKGRGTLCSGG
jgi:hypothetical protein